jgi:exodeoxyribonuclease VII large subunit
MKLMLSPGYANSPYVFTVSQISRYLKDLLETNAILQDIWVQGEVSDCRTYPSGNCYVSFLSTPACVHLP